MARQVTQSSNKVSLEHDEIRDLLLDFLYAHHKQARGVRAQEIKITDLQRKMKVQYSLTAKEVAASLDYLVQKDWVREISRQRTYTTSGGAVIPREQVTYKIQRSGHWGSCNGLRMVHGDLIADGETGAGEGSSDLVQVRAEAA